jgi:hypothetical protein
MNKNTSYLLIAYFATMQAQEYGYKTGFESKLSERDTIEDIAQALEQTSKYKGDDDA